MKRKKSWLDKTDQVFVNLSKIHDYKENRPASRRSPKDTVTILDDYATKLGLP